MPDILFSVLILSVPSRLARLEKLFAKLQGQIGDEKVEVISLLDNKQMIIGSKRNALVSAARGHYLAFVDDDDDVSDDYVAKITGKIKEELEHPGFLADVIVFRQRCTFVNAKCISCLEIDGPPFEVDHDISNPMEAVHQYPDGTWRNIRRKPWQHNAWRRTLAQSVKFPDSSFGEDGVWCEALWPMVARQVKIDATLHYYQFNGKTTEAS